MAFVHHEMAVARPVDVVDSACLEVGCNLRCDVRGQEDPSISWTSLQPPEECVDDGEVQARCTLVFGEEMVSSASDAHIEERIPSGGPSPGVCPAGHESFNADLIHEGEGTQSS
ncbi:MAG: hypothetical protein A2W00_00115 [Candidatus Eisenbacteria bacterium RBG_16_71_46]|nr:MAG: hypothetical protein A2W00_00115 [Candidatus Eisenbacteria bacterium RBG_16_71_46]